MRLRELIFQGVFGAERPSRLRPDGSLARLELPKGMSVEAVHELLIACLYPLHLSEERREQIGLDDTSKIAAVLETRRGVFRVIRRAEPSTVRLQRKKEEGYEDLASGASRVESLLREKLNLPELRVFFPLHLWRFDAEKMPRAQESAKFGDDPRVPEVVDLYLTSLEVEALEDKLKDLEARIEEGKKALGQGEKLHRKLMKAEQKLDEIAVDEMSEEELNLLQNKEETIQEFRDELKRLQEQEDVELEQIQKLIPEKPTRQPRFWAGIAVAVLALVVSFVLHETHREIALGAILGFALGGFELLQYFNNMGRASVHKVRLASIRRRINQVCEEEILFRERIDHLLLHAGVEDESELHQRIPKAAKLRKVIRKLEEKLEEVRRDPNYRRARKELDSLQEEWEELKVLRKEQPSFVMNSFQLENDLKTMGVDPVEVREWAEQSEGGEDDEFKVESPFQWLRSVAQWTDQWSGDELDSRARATWSKICGHVLSDRFSNVGLSPEGELEVAELTPEQLELWQRTRSSEVRAVASALALALHINSARNTSKGVFSSVWIGDLGAAMTPEHASKFESVFRSAAKKSQIVICQS